MPPTNPTPDPSAAKDYIPKYIVVHHSAADAPDPQFEAINEWHRQRGFTASRSGKYVGYHVVIEKDGTVQRAREDLERDCDALGHNFDSLSVCLVGNFDKTDPTTPQILALGKLLADWCSKYTIHPTQIFPHRHFASKSCYGSRLENDWAAIVCLSQLAGAGASWLSTIFKRP